MSKAIDSLRKALDGFRTTKEAYALHLRLTLSSLVMKGMDDANVSVAGLSRASGVSEKTIDWIIHADRNCTLITAAKLLHALGIKAEMMEA